MTLHHNNVAIFNLFISELQLINTKSVIKKKLKDLVGDLKKFRVKTILALQYKKINDHKTIHKIFHSSAKLIANIWTLIMHSDQ